MLTLNLAGMRSRPTDQHFTNDTGLHSWNNSCTIHNSEVLKNQRPKLIHWNLTASSNTIISTPAGFTF
ncbi:hypothetical protein Golomagni_03589 [Golovinomyces magnicellulatus]|nr:hypothetical protein Golomagni_03589 [Golovinomyces magnicellulatus]